MRVATYSYTRHLQQLNSITHENQTVHIWQTLAANQILQIKTFLCFFSAGAGLKVHWGTAPIKICWGLATPHIRANSAHFNHHT